ncbi:hypothetical protein F4679DRAFT_573986 [Xylaria curta]|nr:hypothetical protein F4679DRAFT_573986 [Xylaria curta]
MASQWVGALPPPPGVEPNFIDPPSQRERNIALHTVLLSLITIFVSIRIYTRIWITKNKLGVEDYLCLTSYTLSILFSGLTVKAYTYGIGRHIWDTPIRWLPQALKYFSISSWVYLVLTACVKLTFLFFYRRIFSTRTKIRYIFIDGAIILVVLLNISLFIATILSCIPVQREWDTTVPGHCINPVILPYFSGVSSSATDIYVLILPITLLWGLNMNTQRKIRVSSIFGLGILSVASSLVRLAETPSLRTNPDATWTISNIIVWAALEVNVGIICSCFTTLPAFFDRHISLSTSNLLSHLFSPSSSKKETNSADPSIGTSGKQWSGYKQSGDSESQNFVKAHPKNIILQTNTFSVE